MYRDELVRDVMRFVESKLVGDELLVAAMGLFLVATENHVEGAEMDPGFLHLGPGDLEMLTETAEKFEKFLTQ